VTIDTHILLDTHSFLWIIQDPKHLSEPAKEAFLNPANTLFFSMASYWEICIRAHFRKVDRVSLEEKTLCPF
jgi:PIN domain nuclease of toxin-antitoxin system